MNRWPSECLKGAFSLATVFAIIASPATAAELHFQCSLKQRSFSASSEGTFVGVTSFARKLRLKDGVLNLASVEMRNCTLTEVTIECDSTDVTPIKGNRSETRKRTFKINRTTGDIKLVEAFSGFSSDVSAAPDIRTGYSQSGVCKQL